MFTCLHKNSGSALFIISVYTTTTTTATTTSITTSSTTAITTSLLTAHCLYQIGYLEVEVGAQQAQQVKHGTQTRVRVTSSDVTGCHTSSDVFKWEV